MNTRMMFERGVAGRVLDRIYMIDRIKKGAGEMKKIVLVLLAPLLTETRIL